MASKSRWRRCTWHFHAETSHQLLFLSRYTVTTVDISVSVYSGSWLWIVLGLFGPCFLSLVSLLCRITNCNRASACYAAACPSLWRPNNAVFCLNECTYRRTFWHSGRCIILIFEPHRRYTIPRGTPSAGRSIHGLGNNCDFRPKSSSISETVRDRPVITIDC